MKGIFDREKDIKVWNAKDIEVDLNTGRSGSFPDKRIQILHTGSERAQAVLVEGDTEKDTC